MKIRITILRGPKTKKIVVESNVQLYLKIFDVAKRLNEAERTLNELLPDLRFHIEEVTDA